MSLTIERYVSVLHPFARFNRLFAIEACLFTISFVYITFAMLRSFAVYTIPVIVFALVWNIPRFGEPVFLLIFQLPNELF